LLVLQPARVYRLTGGNGNFPSNDKMGTCVNTLCGFHDTDATGLTTDLWQTKPLSK